MLLHAEFTASRSQGKPKFKNLSAGTLFHFDDKHGHIIFGLIIKVKGQKWVLWFYDGCSPEAFPHGADFHSDPITLIEGPDAFVTLTSQP